METTIPSRSLGQPGFLSDARAFLAVLRREWTIFTRYPSWIIALFIWPLIFPMMYILTARALSGPDGSGLAVFIATTGATDYIGYIIIGTTVWMWQNIVLWDVGFALRNEQMRGTLESNWLSPTWRFSYLLGQTGPQIVSMAMFIGITALEFGILFGVITFVGGSITLLIQLFFTGIVMSPASSACPRAALRSAVCPSSCTSGRGTPPPARRAGCGP